MLLESAIYDACTPQDHLTVKELYWMCHPVWVYFGKNDIFFFEVKFKLCYLICFWLYNSNVQAVIVLHVALWRAASGHAVLDRSIKILCGQIFEGPVT